MMRRNQSRPCFLPPVGAGDAFNGALAEGREFKKVVAWANAAAALAVTQPGAQSALPFRDAIDRLAAQVFGPWSSAGIVH
jgi:sugar/nucleoside kinase (ribokinase family)